MVISTSLTIDTRPSIVLPATVIFRGQHDPDDAAYAGPSGGEASFLSPGPISALRFELAPEGSGVYRYVDGTNGSDANDGLSAGAAKATIQAAIDDRTAGDCILVAPGVYGERLTLDLFGDARATEAAPIKLCRWGTGKVEVTGTDPLTGWTQATNSTEAGGNVNVSSIWFKDITPTYPTGVADSFLMQSGVIASLNMIGDGFTDADSMVIVKHKTLWWDGNDAGSEIADLTRSATTGTIVLTSARFQSIPQGALDDALIHINGNNNTYYRYTIDAHDAVAGTITFTHTGSNAFSSSKQMAISNVAPELSGPGQWSFSDNGDGTFRIYFWPYDATKMDEVRFTARRQGIEVGVTSDWRLYGIDITGVALAGGNNGDEDGYALVSLNRNGTSIRERVRVIECRAYACHTGFNLMRHRGLRLVSCQADTITEGRGMDFTRCADTATYGWKTEKTGLTGVNFYTQGNLDSTKGCLHTFFRVGEVRSVHGNGGSNYLKSKNNWLHGGEFDTKYAIGLTTQDSGNLYLSCCAFYPSNNGVDSNKLYDDNSRTPAGYGRGSGDLDGEYTVVASQFPTPGEMRIVSCTFAPWSDAAGTEANASAVTFGKTTNADHYLGACAVFGTTLHYNYVDDTSGTTYTATENHGPNSNVFVGSTLDAGNAVFSNGEGNVRATNAADVWTDFANGDLTPKAGGPLDGTAADQSARLPLTETWFTDLGVTELVEMDFTGNTINWTAPPIGAYA